MVMRAIAQVIKINNMGKKQIKDIYKMKGQYKYSISCINDHGTLLKTQHEEAYTLQVARRLCMQVSSDLKNLSTHLINQ